MLSFDTPEGSSISVATRFRAGREWVSWCSDWSRVDELVRWGDLRRHNRGPATYGHVDSEVVPYEERPRGWTV